MSLRDARRQRGFSLLEVLVAFSIMAMSLVVLYRTSGGSVKAVADAKLEQVEQKIVELTRFRENLKSLSDICCGGPRSAEHCAILETLESGAPSRHEHHDHEH